MILGGSDIGKGSIFRAILLFLGGFVLAATGLHWFVANPFGLYSSERSEKLEILRRNNFAYSSAMFGSSHVQQGFNPGSFDAGVAGTALDVHSYNLGVDGGSQPEQLLIAQYFLAHLKLPPEPRPCLVMLEATAPSTFSRFFGPQPREINMFDWRALRLTLQFPGLPRDRTTFLYRSHQNFMLLEAAFDNSINLGMLSNRIFRPAYDEDAIEFETKDDQRGQHFIQPNAASEADVNRSFGLRHFPPEAIGEMMSEGNKTVMEELHNSPNGDRVQFAWVAMPELGDLIRYKLYPSTETTSFGEVPIFDLARPDLYPELYDRSMWLDNQHLNAQGSKLFSALLAQQMLTWFSNHPIHSCGS